MFSDSKFSGDKIDRNDERTDVDEWVELGWVGMIEQTYFCSLFVFASFDFDKC